MVNTIRITFVAHHQHDVSRIMQMAFDQSKIQYNLNPEWATTDECLNLDKAALPKTSIFIFEDFAGAAFEYLKTSNALIIGTRCLLKCLSRTKEIPPWPHPIYSLAMEGIAVSVTGFKLHEKDKIREYVQWMGGRYDKEMHKETTHLISNNVTSIKYSKAAGLIPVMQEQWINALWEATNKDTVIGECEEFMKESLVTYRLKPFHGLHITSASLPRLERDRVKTCVENNGGTYMGNYKGVTTDMVVLTEDGVLSAKYKAAREAHKECVSPAWIYESEAAGYALPTEMYRIVAAKCSTPTKPDNTLNLDNNFSMMSEIDVADRHRITSVNESTVMGSALSSGNCSMARPQPPGDKTAISPQLSSARPQPPGDNTRISLQLTSGAPTVRGSFDMKEVRAAGLFLDGCGIYLAGFSTEDRELLNRVLNSGGATRYDDASDRISHIILAKPGNLDMKPFHDKNLMPFVVDIRWLLECVRQKRVVLEDDFIIGETSCIEKPSKISMFVAAVPPQLDKSFSPRTERLEEISKRMQVMQMYKNASNITNETTESTVTSTVNEESTIKVYFQGRKFFIHSDLNLEMTEEVQEYIANAAGSVTRDLHQANYVIVPELCTKEILVQEDCQLVSPIFIRDCMEQQCEVPVQYFHRPILESSDKPLKGLAITVGSYKGLERYHIGELIKSLGAEFMDVFLRRPSAARGLPASTHLVCTEPQGEKYKACVLWGLPAVHSGWLQRCQRERRLVPEQDYLIGDTKAPVRAEVPKDESTGTTTSSRSFAGPSSGVNRKRNGVWQDENSFEENASKKLAGSGGTPVANKFLGGLGAMSQETPPPVSKILERLKCRTNDTPETPPRRPLPEYLRTPDSPYGAFLFPNPSPETRKRWKRRCDALPGQESPPPPKTPSPTWSDVKREVWEVMLKPRNSQQSKGVKLDFEKDVTEIKAVEQNIAEVPSETREQSKHAPGINTQLQKLNELLTTGLGVNVSKNKSTTPISRNPSLHNIYTIATDTKVVAKDSQAESVGWCDPSELESNNMTESALEEIQPFRKRPPKFLLSSVEEKEQIAARIQELGGEVCSIMGNQYDDTCSHVVCDRPGRSEKLLAGMSAGKWILSTDYIAHCIQEGRFVEEEPFEWGNPNGEYCHEVSPESHAIYRWRCKLNHKPIENVSEGAFTGWKVILFLDRKASFERVIRAGHGVVVDCSRVESLREGSVTHCFCEPRKQQLSTDDIRHLIRIGAQVLPVQYLNKYIVDSPPPNPKEHLITV